MKEETSNILVGMVFTTRLPMPEVKELRNRGMVYSLGLPVYQINLKTKNEPAIYRHRGKTSRGLQGCSEISSFETTQLLTLFFMYDLIVPRRLVDTHESKHFASQPHVSMSCYLMCDTRKHLVCPCKLGSGESGGGQGDATNGRSIWVDLSGICSWMIRFHLTPERSCWPRWNEYPFLTGA